MIEDKLQEVLDPELQISIVDLGLIYKITVSGKKVHILMTLTSLGCPLYDSIEEEIHSQLEAIGIDRSDVEIELTFDPPWSMDLISERAKAMLGI